MVLGFGSSTGATPSRKTRFHLNPLAVRDIPEPRSPLFDTWLNDVFKEGQELIDSMDEWHKHSTQHNSTVQCLTLPSSGPQQAVKKRVGIKDFWCGRESYHTPTELAEIKHAQAQKTAATPADGSAPPAPTRRLSLGLTSLKKKRAEEETQYDAQHGSVNGEPSEAARALRIMSDQPEGIYERFRRGLLEYHSEHEREYIESCRESEQLDVFRKHVAEVWRMTYVTPPPTNPRTFVILLLCRELVSSPVGSRQFMNISIPFDHPACPPKEGNEKNRVRAKYVSVERVTEMDGGEKVEWKMCTSSDAGGNIPRSLTNYSLPSKISEDVPSFLEWMVRRFPDGGNIDSQLLGSKPLVHAPPTHTNGISNGDTVQVTEQEKS